MLILRCTGLALPQPSLIPVSREPRVLTILALKDNGGWFSEHLVDRDVTFMVRDGEGKTFNLDVHVTLLHAGSVEKPFHFDCFGFQMRYVGQFARSPTSDMEPKGTLTEKL
ncbi:MAG: hypothetical protein V1907_01600 [Candidatus Kerfeldbacteria bacterium]